MNFKEIVMKRKKLIILVLVCLAVISAIIIGTRVFTMSAKAEYRLGNNYYYGQGVPKNYAKAVYWYRKAAKQGYAPAQWQLSNAYGNGQGIPKNYAKAVYWLKKAAKGGYVKAQNALFVLDHSYGF